MDTFRSVLHGSGDDRIRAVLTFGVWFAVGAFLAASAQHYLPVDGSGVPLAGGFIATALAAIFKFT